MLAYPSTFPVESFNIFLQAVLTRQLNAAKLAQAAWELSGYLLGQSLGMPTLVNQAGPSAASPEDEAIASLNTLQQQIGATSVNVAVTPVSQGQQVSGFVLDWKLVIQAAIALALELLNRKKQSP